MITFDEKINKYFFFWLMISFLTVFLIVIVGGLTRLTDSGLSITEWELFKGILPPLKESSWIEYFNLYKQIPQFKLINSGMTMEEFKIIFYWEYAHRFLARFIGIFFLIPLVYFFFTKKVNKKYLSICYLIFFLILIQGMIGWYMVKSGLIDDITVSHYRLSLHLSIAFIIASMIFWNLLNVYNKTFKIFFKFNKIFLTYQFLIILILFQVIIGAFVSGLDAGKIYQSWPLMDSNYFPGDVQITKFNNLFQFDNHGLIQFYHRNIAYIIIIYFFVIGFFILSGKNIHLKKSFYLVSFILILQVFLGITTLISGLNIFLASGHQVCSLLLLLSVINLYYNYIN